jgi:hypothetical protein
VASAGSSAGAGFPASPGAFAVVNNYIKVARRLPPRSPVQRRRPILIFFDDSNEASIDGPSGKPTPTLRVSFRMALPVIR